MRATSADGAIGLGNVDPAQGYSRETVDDSLRALGEKLAPAVIGSDPANVHLVLQRIDAVIPGFFEAKAAIEMACVDLVARSCGIPVYTYLGGAVKERLLFNGWIGIVPPDEAAKQALALKNAGFQSAKIKVSDNIKSDHDRVKAVREAVGPEFNLRIDANASYDADTSIKLAHLLLPYNLQLFEQPVPAEDISGMARVRRESGGVPIMADESVVDHASLIQVIRHDAADIVKVKIMKQGGFLNTSRMICSAEAAGIRSVIGHGFGLGISTMAETMLAATFRSVMDGLECIGPLNTTDDIIDHRLDLTDGTLSLPKGAGLGITLDEAKVDRYGFAKSVVT
ncbi:hypothetical protein HY524_02235 [Candidatus Berkelbacteria bacterium]|nr:hypothetical protein [Candidatus Berkelbacteria bacterium]